MIVTTFATFAILASDACRAAVGTRHPRQANAVVPGYGIALMQPSPSLPATTTRI
jgi:hypothetical protein